MKKGLLLLMSLVLISLLRNHFYSSFYHIKIIIILV